MLSDSVLSFGCAGFGMKPTSQFIKIPLRRGAQTLMDGYAANCFTHCIRSEDTKKESISIIFRTIHKNVYTI